MDAKDRYQHLKLLPRVIGVMVINREGITIRSALSEEETLKYAAHIGPLVDKSRKIIQELPVNDEEALKTDVFGHHKNVDEVTFIRIRTLDHEVLVPPCRSSIKYHSSLIIHSFQKGKSSL